jgi:hypothetical protein
LRVLFLRLLLFDPCTMMSAKPCDKCTMIMVNYVDMWLIHSHVAGLLDSDRLELRELMARFTLLGVCTACPVLRSDLKAVVVEIKDLKHKLDHFSRYTVLSPPCEVCVSLKSKLFHGNKENTELNAGNRSPLTNPSEVDINTGTKCNQPPNEAIVLHCCKHHHLILTTRLPQYIHIVKNQFWLLYKTESPTQHAKLSTYFPQTQLVITKLTWKKSSSAATDSTSSYRHGQSVTELAKKFLDFDLF